MLKRSGACYIAGVGLLALSIVAFPSLVCAQSADLVLCDRIAADPADPDKPADVRGTPAIAAPDIATAIKFCKIASASSRRALYELGRAYAANRQMPEALAAYRKAADKGSTSAMVELGVLLGTGTGVAKGRSTGAQAVRTRRRSPVMHAASAIWPRSAAARPQIPPRHAPCCRRARKRIRRKRNISSV